MSLKMEGWWLAPEDVKAVQAYITEHRTSKAPFDIAIIGSRNTAGKGGAREAKKVAMLAEAGATWRLEALYLQRNSLERLQGTIRMEPPK